MRRDWSIIKELLEEVEPLNRYSGLTLTAYYLGDHKSDEQTIHKVEMALLMLEDGFIHANRSATIGPHEQLSNINLTNRGHDLLDALRDDNLWNKVINTAKSQGLKITAATIPTIIQSVFF